MEKTEKGGDKKQWWNHSEDKKRHTDSSLEDSFSWASNANLFEDSLIINESLSR